MAQLPSSGSNKRAYNTFRNGEKKFFKGNLERGERTFSRAARKYESSGNVDGFIASKAMEAIVLLNQDNPKAAWEAFRYAEELFNEQPNPNDATRAYLRLCLGKYHLHYDEYEEADGFLKEANEILEAHPEYVSPIFEVELQQSLGTLYQKKGEKQDALTFYEEIVESIEKMDATERNEELVDKVNDMISQMHVDLATPDAAADYFIDKLKKGKNNGTMNKRQETKMNIRAGKSLFEFTDYESAYNYLMNALEGEVTPEEEALIKSMLAKISMSVRDYKDALDKNGDALSIQLKIGAPAGDLFHSFVQQGKICQELDDIDNSVYWYKKTLENLSDDWTVQQELEKYGLEGIELADNPMKNTPFNIALLNFKRAELLLEDLPPRKQKKARIDLYMAKGNLYYDAFYNDEAEEFYNKALVLLEDNYPDRYNLRSETYRYLAELKIRRKDLQLADAFADKALNAALDEGVYFDINNLPQDMQGIKYPYEILYALVTKAAVVHRINAKIPTEENMRAPLLYTEFGQGIIQDLKKTHRHESAKYELSELTQDINHQAIATARVLYILNAKREYIAMVFSFMERTKSSLLLQAVQQLRAQNIADVPEYVIEKENKLKTKIAYLTSEIHYETKEGVDANRKRLLKLQKDLKDAKEDYPDYLDYIEKNYPKYYALKYEQKLSSLDDLQAGLKYQETFVNYVIVDSLIHVLAIDDKEIIYETTRTPSSFKGGIARYVSSLKGKKTDVFLRYSNILYDVLIKPIKDKVMDRDLIVIPDGPLNYIPFEIVPTELVPQSWPKGDFSLYKEVPYLLKSSSVVYNYSATLFLDARNNKAQDITKGFVGFAPDFSNVESFTLSQKHQKKKYEDLLLTPLDNAAIEVAMIGDLTEGKTWIGLEATEAAFKKHASDYGVIHFATHGILNHKFPLYSNLVLLGDEKEDGLLHTFELYNMEINAELVALSACNTGVGKIQKGEGAMSIARGFSYAGCPNIAMTLWAVSDQATQILMEQFYMNLMSGMPKGEALRQAKLHFLNSGSGLITVPYFWSGMLIMGTPDRIQSLNTLPFYMLWSWTTWAAIVGGSFLLISLIVFLIIKRIRK